jgi:hypothetical protein
LVRERAEALQRFNAHLSADDLAVRPDGEFLDESETRVRLRDLRNLRFRMALRIVRIWRQLGDLAAASVMTGSPMLAGFSDIDIGRVLIKSRTMFPSTAER